MKADATPARRGSTAARSSIQVPDSMDGLKLAHAVHERWLSIKIILVSGKITPSDEENLPRAVSLGKAMYAMNFEICASPRSGAVIIFGDGQTKLLRAPLLPASSIDLA